MRRKNKVGIFSWHYINDEWLHVTVGFRFGQRMVFHVFAWVNRIIGEADSVFCLFLTAYHRPHFVLIVQESPQPYTQYTSNLNQRSKRRDIDIIFDTLNLFHSQTRTLRQFFYGYWFIFAEWLNFLSYNFTCIHIVSILVVKGDKL